jgi:hypothetical protein
MTAGDDEAEKLRVGRWITDPIETPGSGTADKPAEPVIRDAAPPATHPAARMGTRAPEGQETPDPALGPAWGTVRGPAPEPTQPEQLPEPATTPEHQSDSHGDRHGLGNRSRNAGRKHASEPTRLRRFLLAAGVLACVVLAVMIPLAVFPGSPPSETPSSGPPGGAARMAPSGSAAGGGPVPIGTEMSTSTAPVPGASPTTPSGAPSPAATAGPATRTSSPTPRLVGFTPITIEAEAKSNTLGGPARVTKYLGASGGNVVRNIGDWDSSRGNGWLRFDLVTVPADGVYKLTFFHVDIDDEPSGIAVVTVSGAASVSLSVAGGSTCCSASAVKVSLMAGANSVTFTNEDGHAPSIDKIVISLP